MIPDYVMQDEKTRSRYVYEMSQGPGWQILLDIISGAAAGYSCQPPKGLDQTIEFFSASISRSALDEVMRVIEHYREEGERLSRLEQKGEIVHGRENQGYYGAGPGEQRPKRA